MKGKNTGKRKGRSEKRARRKGWRDISLFMR